MFKKFTKIKTQSTPVGCKRHLWGKIQWLGGLLLSAMLVGGNLVFADEIDKPDPGTYSDFKEYGSVEFNPVDPSTEREYVFEKGFIVNGTLSIANGAVVRATEIIGVEGESVTIQGTKDFGSSLVLNNVVSSTWEEGGLFKSDFTVDKYGTFEATNETTATINGLLKVSENGTFTNDSTSHITLQSPSEINGTLDQNGTLDVNDSMTLGDGKINVLMTAGEKSTTNFNGALIINENATLNNKEQANLTGNTTTIAGSLNNDGTVTFNGATTINSTGLLTNSNTANLNGTTEVSGYLDNIGTATFADTTTVTSTGTLTNNGTVDLKDTTVAGTFNQNGTANLKGATTVSGTFDATKTSTTNLEKDSSLTLVDGAKQAKFGALNVKTGSTMTQEKNTDAYVQGALDVSGTLNADNIGNGENSQLTVDGTTTVSGTLSTGLKSTTTLNDTLTVDKGATFTTGEDNNLKVAKDTTVNGEMNLGKNSQSTLSGALNVNNKLATDESANLSVVNATIIGNGTDIAEMKTGKNSVTNLQDTLTVSKNATIEIGEGDSTNQNLKVANATIVDGTMTLGTNSKSSLDGGLTLNSASAFTMNDGAYLAVAGVNDGAKFTMNKNTTLELTSGTLKQADITYGDNSKIVVDDKASVTNEYKKLNVNLDVKDTGSVTWEDKVAKENADDLWTCAKYDSRSYSPINKLFLVNHIDQSIANAVSKGNVYNQTLAGDGIVNLNSEITGLSSTDGYFFASGFYFSMRNQFAVDRVSSYVVASDANVKDFTGTTNVNNGNMVLKGVQYGDSNKLAGEFNVKGLTLDATYDEASPSSLKTLSIKENGSLSFDLDIKTNSDNTVVATPSHLYTGTFSAINGDSNGNNVKYAKDYLAANGVALSSSSSTLHETFTVKDGAQLWFNTGFYTDGTINKKVDETSLTIAGIHANTINLGSKTSVYYHGISTLNAGTDGSGNPYQRIIALEGTVYDGAGNVASSQYVNNIFSTKLTDAKYDSTSQTVTLTTNTFENYAINKGYNNNEVAAAKQVDESRNHYNQLLASNKGESINESKRALFEGTWNENDEDVLKEFLDLSALDLPAIYISSATTVGVAGSAFFNGLSGMRSETGRFADNSDYSDMFLGQSEDDEHFDKSSKTDQQKSDNNQPTYQKGALKGWNISAQATYSTLNAYSYQDRKGDFDGYNIHRAGLLLDFNKRYNDKTSGGFVFAYQGPELFQQAHANKTDIDNLGRMKVDDFQLGYYLNHSLQHNCYIASYVGMGMQNAYTNRQVYVSNVLSGDYNSETTGNTFTFQVTLGKMFKVAQNSALTTFMSFDTEQFWLNAFSEQTLLEGDASLTDMGYSYNKIYYGCNNLRFGMNYVQKINRMSINGGLTYSCQLDGDLSPYVTATDNETGFSLTRSTHALGRHSLLLNCGFSYLANEANTFRIFGGYSAKLYEHANVQLMQLGCSYQY